MGALSQSAKQANSSLVKILYLRQEKGASTYLGVAILQKISYIPILIA
jgi:ribosomal protein L35AE/L33A